MSNNIHILLIEDDEDDYLLTVDCIESIIGSKYEVTWERDGMAAISGQVPFDMYDVVLVDYHVGGVTGVEIVQSAIGNGAFAPFILLTGHSDREIDYAAMQAGAVDHLVKDRLSPEVLEKAVRYAIAAAASRRVLSQKSELLAATLESTDVGMAAFDVNENIVMWNKRMADLVATSGAGETAIRAGIDIVVNRAKNRRGRAIEALKPNGEGVLEARLKPLEAGGYTLVCIDVSKHKAIEDALLSAKDEAERLSKAKSMFIARLSHEMRTPLHAVIGFGKMLPSASKPEIEEFSDIIVSSGQRLVNKIDQMLELSRMDLGEAQTSARDIPAQAIAKEAITIALRAAPVLSDRLQVISGLEDTFITGDHRALSSAVAELICNAAKHGAADTPIEIGAHTDPECGEVRIWVTNTSSSEQMPISSDMFESFGQADQTLERAKEGLGIGLTYVRAVAKLHGGDAHLEQNDQSAKVTVALTLPRTSAIALSRATEIMNVA